MALRDVVDSFWDLSTPTQVAVLVVGAAAFGGLVITAKRSFDRLKILPLGDPECDKVRERGGEVAGFRYLERLSKGANPNATLPMVVVFHSRGAKPESFTGWANSIGVPARVIVPEGPLELGENRSWFELGARTDDQMKLARQMEDIGDRMARFLADITRCRPTRGNPVVTGSSQGGSMAYLMASRHPQFVRGAVAAAGWLPKALWSSHLAPTVGLHGMKDTTVPFDWTAEWAETMQAEGAPVSFRIYDTGHVISREMLADWRNTLNEMVSA